MVRDIPAKELGNHAEALISAMNGNRSEWLDFTTMEKLIELAASGTAFVGVCGDNDAFVIAKRRGKFMNISWSGGRKITPYVGHIDEWLCAKAKETGASHIRMSGRLAWKRLLSAKGWRMDSVTMTKGI